MDNSQQDTSVNLVNMWLILWKQKLFIFIFVAISCVLAVVYSLTMPNIYKSAVLLAPHDSKESSALGALGSQIGGFASLAGVNLDSGSNDTLLHLEVLKSKDFLFEFFSKYEVSKVLFGAKEYDKNSEKLLFDEEKLELSSGKWKVNPETGESFEPTLFETYESFNKLFDVKHNKVTNLVTVSIRSIDPHIAKQWVSNLISELNEQLRQRELDEKSRSIAYIQQQLDKTEVAQMKNVFYTIIEEQTKQMLLAEVREDFAFRIIESPIVAERKESPSRAVICILAAIFSVFFASGLVLVRHFMKELKGSGY
ncbi:Wzz/FepE/Etk N-terminal domain-containing protein [Pseudoalteromonas piscicida]|uniref:Polysaccharide chain length determinant N-terminal domain-containing protein n=1 Tax=Pseudoalteromonas piscicida TaxID=43662 RepID=A0ABM6NIW7_PSEO7|nr:Wzz/FepE/Etk N-terminal domain-containing protein [Pseudoalteromonas piscicida]ATD08943.1 hypothetical protein PPIS_a4294 [Pseudoalteromonas piscicida]WPU30926.1 Wzz/FepE/Etk N-terminal domain-containing protein [Pseudoalteromonas piscicida]